MSQSNTITLWNNLYNSSNWAIFKCLILYSVWDIPLNILWYFMKLQSKGTLKSHLVYWQTNASVHPFNTHTHKLILLLPCCLVSSSWPGPGIWGNVLRGRWSKGRRGLVSHGSCEGSAWFLAPPADNSQTACRCSPPLADSYRTDG